MGYWDQADALVERAYGELGKVDVLVNNAGMSPLYPSLASPRSSESLYDKVMDVNLKGCLPPRRWSIGERMAAGEGGSIISVSSACCGAPDTAGEAVYGLAKAGLHNMTFMLSPAPTRPRCAPTSSCPAPSSRTSAKAWGSPEDVAAKVMAQAHPAASVREIPEEVDRRGGLPRERRQQLLHGRRDRSDRWLRGGLRSQPLRSR